MKWIRQRIRSGELEIVYVRYDENADKFYCTLKPKWPLVPGIGSIPSTTMAALSGVIALHHHTEGK